MTRKASVVRIALSTTILVLALLLVPAAFADKGGGGGKGGKTKATGSFSLVQLNSTDGLLHYGQDVTFSVSSTATYPSVQLTCYQGGPDWVKNQFVGFYPGYAWSQIFSLDSWMWTGGAADCNARLFDGLTDATFATMSFHVYA